jgi:hypothetical protein
MGLQIAPPATPTPFAWQHLKRSPRKKLERVTAGAANAGYGEQFGIVLAPISR